MSTTLEIATLKDVMTLGDVLARSGFFQDARGAAQAVVKVLAGRELGFGPIASMTGVHIVKGKPVMSAMLIAAAIKRSGKYDYKIREHTKTVCKLEFFEGGQSTGHSDFSADEAKDAGLGGDNWRHYPKNMLFARAVSNGAKWYCPDIFGGPVYTPDELGIDVDGDTGEVRNLSSVTVPEIPELTRGGRKEESPHNPTHAMDSSAAFSASSAPPPREPISEAELVEESEELFLDPEKDRLVQECGAIIKEQLAAKKITQKDIRTMKATYLGAEDANPDKCDISALTDLRAYLKTRFER